MSVAIVVDDQWEISRCVEWGARFAEAEEEALTVIVLEEGQGETRFGELKGDAKPSLVAAAALDCVAKNDTLQLVTGAELEQPNGAATVRSDAQAEQSEAPRDGESQNTSGDAAPDAARIAVRVILVATPDKSAALLQFVKRYSTSLLILPRHRTNRGLDAETPWEQAVYRRASCATLLLCPTEVAAIGVAGQSVSGEAETKTQRQPDQGGVLAPVDDGRTSVISLRLAKRLSETLGKPLTALYVEPNVGDVAPDVGRRIVDRVVARTLGGKLEARRDVVVGESVRNAIHDYAQQGEFELIVLGANRIGVGRRWVTLSISEWLMGQETEATVAVIRPPLPLAHRFSTQVAEWLRERVPQLDREARVSLYERIQSSSRWDFDFIALICLSTIIATLGLIQDSPAVVIGAMLVAPLMTPLVGAGLALVQGNRILMLRAWGTVLRGFLLAFFIGFVIGWCVPGLTESREMLARGSPNVLDLGVALIGGIAASYALGRPNLFSALPGVAIAAALVPPIATAGLAASLGNFPLASGSLLLFATNIVAIVLGTAIALFAVGIRGAHEHGVMEAWAYRIAVALIVLASVMGVYEFVPHHQVPVSLKDQLGESLTAAGATLREARLASSERVQLTVHSPTALTPALRASLAAVVRSQLGKAVTLEIDTRLITIEAPVISAQQSSE